jgi:hypothetical protein
VVNRAAVLKRIPNWLALVVLAPLWVPLLLVVLVAVLPALGIHHVLRTRLLARAFRSQFSPQGKRLVLVYSRSPNWQPYIEANWLPKLAERAVVVDWSDRSHWQAPLPLAVRIARHWGGDREFNPLAIVFPPRGKPRVIRFYRPFLALKHGRVSELQDAENELFALLSEQPSGAA